MSERVFQLHFVGTPKAELFQTRFQDSSLRPIRTSVRGKTSGAYTNAGSFHLSSAVRALCVLCVKSVIVHQSMSDKLPIILGTQGSLAASLDYALTKQPIWIQEMFGSDLAGNSLAQRLFSRTNSHRKRPGPVVIKINEKALSLANIHIFRDGRVVDDVRELLTLLSLLEANEESAELATDGILRTGRVAA